jgi:hypothetical protein
VNEIFGAVLADRPLFHGPRRTIRPAASGVRLDFERLFLGDRMTPKLIVGGLLAISGVAIKRDNGGTHARVNVEIVKRSDRAKGFVVLPKRWVVERTFAWLGRCRRLAKDWENLNRKALAFLRLASIRLMLRKLCNPV